MLLLVLRVLAEGLFKRWCIEDFEDILDIAYARCKAAGLI